MGQLDYQNDRDPETGLPKEEPGIEEGDWLDYISPLKSMFEGEIATTAGVMARKGMLKALRDKGAPGQQTQQAPSQINYTGAAFKPITTKTEATTGFTNPAFRYTNK